MKKRVPPAAAWKPGQSGNPKGRPKGETKVAKLREAIGEHVPEIIAKLVEQAKAGDPGAARLLLERILPPVKPIEQPVRVNLPAGSLGEQGRALLAAAGDGVLAPSQAAQLLTSLGAVAKLIETDELQRRIAALEEKHGIKP